MDNLESFMSISDIEFFNDLFNIAVEKNSSYLIDRLNIMYEDKKKISIKEIFSIEETIIDHLVDILCLSDSNENNNKHLLLSIFMLPIINDDDLKYIKNEKSEINFSIISDFDLAISIFDFSDLPIEVKFLNIYSKFYTNLNTFCFKEIFYNVYNVINPINMDVILYFFELILGTIHNVLRINLTIYDFITILTEMNKINIYDIKNKVTKIINSIHTLRQNTNKKFKGEFCYQLIELFSINNKIIDKFYSMYNILYLKKDCISLMKLINEYFSENDHEIISELIIKISNENGKLTNINSFISNMKLLSKHSYFVDNIIDEKFMKNLYFISKYINVYPESIYLFIRLINTNIDKMLIFIQIISSYLVEYPTQEYTILDYIDFLFNIEVGFTDSEMDFFGIENINTNDKFVYTRLARFFLMNKMFDNVNFFDFIGVSVNETIFSKIRYNDLKIQKLKKYYNQTIDVHDGKRDKFTFDAVKILFSSQEILSEEINDLFNNFWEFAKNLLKGEDIEKFKRVIGYNFDFQKAEFNKNDFKSFLFDNILIGEDTIDPKSFIAHIWKFTDRFPEENLKESLIFAFVNSIQFKFNYDYAVCNQGKLQRIVVAILQGRLKDNNNEHIMIDEINNNNSFSEEISPSDMYHILKPFYDSISSKATLNIESFFESFFDYIINKNLLKNLSTALEVVCLYSETKSGFDINHELSIASCFENIFSIDDYFLAKEYILFNYETDEEDDIDDELPPLENIF